MSDKGWDVIRIVGVTIACVSPFWFMASNLTDGDEFIKTGISAGMVTVVSLLIRKHGGKDEGEDKSDKGDKS